MSGAATSGRAGPAGWVRRGGLALVMVGALSVSVRGQVQAVEPLLGGMSLVLALTNDLAALLALNELMTTRRRAVRRWAWAVLLLAGGTAAGLNTWHAVAAGVLPPGWAVVVGIGPVLLAVVLSHLVALVLNDAEADAATPTAAPATAAAASEHTTAVAPTAALPTEPSAAGPTAASASAIESSRAGQVATEALTGPGVHHGLAVVATRPDTGRRAASGYAQPVHGTDPRVEQVAARLRRGADLTGAAVAAQLGCSERTGAAAAAPSPRPHHRHHVGGSGSGGHHSGRAGAWDGMSTAPRSRTPQWRRECGSRGVERTAPAAAATWWTVQAGAR